MPINLNIRVTTESTKSRTEFTKIENLGDNYQQVTNANMGVVKTTWTIYTDFYSYENLENFTTVIDAYAGDETFSIDISPDIGVISVYVNSYTIEFSEHSTGRLILECVEVGGGELTSLGLLLPTTNIPTRVNALYNHLFANSYTDAGSIPINAYKSFSTLVYAIPYQFIPDHYHPEYPIGISRALDCASLARGMINVGETLGNVDYTNLGLASIDAVRNFFFNNPNPVNEFWWYGEFLTSRTGLTENNNLHPNPLNSGVMSVNYTPVLVSGQRHKVNIPRLAKVSKIQKGNFSLKGRYLWADYLKEDDAIEIELFIDIRNHKYTYVPHRDGWLVTENDTGYIAGDVVFIMPLGYSGDVRINHLTYVVTPTIANLSRIDTLPALRNLQLNEVNASSKSLSTLYESFKLAFEATANPAYQDFADGLQVSILKAISDNYDNTNLLEIYLIQPELLDYSASEPYIGIGQGRYTFGNMDAVVTRRALDGIYQINITAFTVSSFSRIAVRNSAHHVVYSDGTNLTVRVWSQLEGFAEVVIVNSLEQQTALEETPISETYYCPFKVEASVWTEYTFSPYEFMKYDYNAFPKTIWFPSKKTSPIIPTGDGAYIVTHQLVQRTIPSFNGVPSKSALVSKVNMTKDTGLAGFFFNTAESEFDGTVGTPSILFRVTVGSVYVVLFDHNDNFFYHLVEIPLNEWTYLSFNDNNIFEFVEGEVYSDSEPINALGIIVANSITNAEVEVFFVGQSPEILPTNFTAYEHYVMFNKPETHVCYIEFLKVNNVENSTQNQTYSPGVLPDRIHLRQGVYKYFGENTIASQIPYLYAMWGLGSHTNSLVNYLKDSQTNNTELSQEWFIKGLFTPSYRDRNYLNHPIQPHPDWSEYHSSFPLDNLEDCNLQYMILLDIVKALYVKENTFYRAIVEDFLDTINYYWTVNGNFGHAPRWYKATDGYPTISSEQNILGSCLVFQIALYANLAKCDRLQTIRVLTRVFAYLENEYNTVGVMAGTWTKNRPFSTINPSYKQLYGQEVGEIFSAYSLLLKYKPQLRYPTKASWDSLF